MMTERAFFILSADRKSGRVTYKCATTELAIRKLEDFIKGGYTQITIAAPDGTPLTEVDLRSLVAGSVSVLTDEDIPAAPQVMRQPALV